MTPLEELTATIQEWIEALRGLEAALDRLGN